MPSTLSKSCGTEKAGVTGRTHSPKKHETSIIAKMSCETKPNHRVRAHVNKVSQIYYVDKRSANHSQMGQLRGLTRILEPSLHCHATCGETHVRPPESRGDKSRQCPTQRAGTSRARNTTRDDRIGGRTGQVLILTVTANGTD